jgi:hypothetical protein
MSSRRDPCCYLANCIYNCLDAYSMNMPTACYFFLDEKVAKKSRPTEICLVRLRNSGKTKTRPAIAGLKQFVFLIGISSSNLFDKFLNAVLKNSNITLLRRAVARKRKSKIQNSSR